MKRSPTLSMATITLPTWSLVGQGGMAQSSLTRVYIAHESKLPIRAEQFGWPEKTSDKPPFI